MMSCNDLRFLIYESSIERMFGRWDCNRVRRRLTSMPRGHPLSDRRRQRHGPDVRGGDAAAGNHVRRRQVRRHPRDGVQHDLGRPSHARLLQHGDAGRRLKTRLLLLPQPVSGGGVGEGSPRQHRGVYYQLWLFLAGVLRRI